MAGEIQVIEGQVFQTLPDGQNNDVAVCIQNGDSYRFTGFDSADDDANLDDLIDIINARGGIIELDGTIQINTTHSILDAPQDGTVLRLGLTGLPGHKLMFGQDGQIIFGYSHAIYTAPSEKLWTDSVNGGAADYPSRKPKWSILQSDNDDGGGAGTGAFTDLNVGDWVYVLADHDIQELHTRHQTTIRELPCELVRVVKPVYEGGNPTPIVGQYFIDGHVHDQMLYVAPPSDLNPSATLGNVRITKPTPTRNVVVKDLLIQSSGRVGTDPGTKSNKQCLQFQHCHDSRLENLTMPYPGGGGILIRGCGNFTVRGGSLGETLNQDEDSNSGLGEGYRFIDNCNKQLIVDGVQFGFCRHVFTTGAAQNTTDPQGTAIRLGTTRDTLVTNCSVGFTNYFSSSNFDTGYKDDTYHGQVAFDCHSEGVGVKFVNNKVQWGRLPTGSTGSAFSTRGRYTIFEGNIALGLPDGFRMYGISVSGPYARVVSNLLRGGWAGIRVSDQAGPVDGAEILYNDITGQYGNGIYLEDGNDHSIVRNRFYQNAQAYTTTSDLNCCLRLGTDVGIRHIIRDNTFATRGMSDDTLYSMSIIPVTPDPDLITDFSGNNCVGYGTDDLGFTANGAALNTQYLELNWCEKTHVGMGRKDNADPAETYSPTLAIDFDAGEYDNKVVLLEGDMAPTFTATRAGDYTITVAQDVTGYHVITWPNNVSWQGQAPQPDPLATRISTFRLFYNGTTFQGLS